MKTCHRQPAQRGAPSSSMSPPSTASITVAALLVLSIPACTGAPADFPLAPTDPRQLLRQIDAVCTSYLHTDLKFWASDLIGELCVMMLVQNSKERRVEEDTKRCPNSTPEGRESSPCALNSRGPGELRAEATFYTGHEMDEDL
ncbi:neuromedin-U isoform X2 [Oryzias melastigma]|uniref:neuromedin-U isoform X2 n=1 Tax=Oryzias melastigma TaxID=30732 RepID=UPI000CF824C0|nr:neuromedin-U isoform X2 [Oryzias melastigma]